MTAHPMTVAAIRALRPGEEAAFTAMALASWRDAYETLLPADQVAGAPAMFARALERRFDRFRVAQGADGALLGFYSLGDAPDEQDYLWHLYVGPAFYGRGIGRTLLSHAEAALRARGQKRAWLDVVAGNVRAQAFYRACGWRSFGRETADGLDLVLMERML